MEIAVNVTVQKRTTAMIVAREQSGLDLKVKRGRLILTLREEGELLDDALREMIEGDSKSELEKKRRNGDNGESVATRTLTDGLVSQMSAITNPMSRLEISNMEESQPKPSKPPRPKIDECKPKE